MVRALPTSRWAWLAPPFLAPTAVSDPLLIRRWWMEVAFTRLRWLVIPSCLLLIPFSPLTRVPLLGLIALGFGLGNYRVVRSLYHAPAFGRVIPAWRLATLLDWVGGLSIVMVCWTDAPIPVTAIVLLLLISIGVRAGRRELLVGGSVSMLFVAAFVGVQVELFSVLPAAVAWVYLAQSEALLLVAVLLLASIAQAGEQWRHWQIEQRQVNDAPLASPTIHLSKRQHELLPLLARRDLTYEQIAEQLCISPETVKTHVHRIGIALGLTAGGRWAVVALARERDLLDADASK